MSNNSVHISTSNDDKQPDEEMQRVKNPDTVTKTEDHTTDNDNDNFGSENKGIEYQEHIDIKNENDDNPHGFKIKHRKDQESKKSVGAYLRSEFSGPKAHEEVKPDGTDRLPKYNEIDMTGYSRKYVDNRTKRTKPHTYSKDVVLVQFMGSETMPEHRVLMTYEPETRNYTVKGMFVMLMMLHFFTFCFTTIYFVSPAREGMIPYGHLICLPCLAIFFIIVLMTACFRICRNACCTCMASFFAVFFLAGFYGALGGYLGKRIFIFNSFASFMSDIFIIFIACGQFDFTTKGTYSLAIGSVVAGLFICVPMMEVAAQNNVYYWADTKFPQETVVSYVLTIIFSVITAMAEIANLQILLNGEWVEVGENDYSFGAYIMFVSLIDYPIRFMRKKGWLNSCDSGGGEDDDDDEEEK